MLNIVVDHYPIKKSPLVGLIYPDNSVQQIPGVWEGIKLDAAGMSVSLNDIEHKILRREFKEPRIHFAIVCASIGCPPLRSEPYVGSKVEQQLEESARSFMSDPSKVRLNRLEKRLQLSKIFQWFAVDFQPDVAGFVSKYLPAHDQKFLAATPVKLEISGL